MTMRAGGVRPWVLQRVSALYMAVFLPVAAISILLITPIDFTGWRELFAQPGVNLAVMLFSLSLIGHAWVGGRDILLDYIHHAGLRFTLMALFGLFLAAMLIWLAGILLPLMGASS